MELPMITTGRRTFDGPGGNDQARKLFENAHTLNISINRGCRFDGDTHGPFVTFEMSGGFEERDGDLVAIAAELMRAFSQLPPVNRNGD
jgi:hypothetical protein